MRQLQSVNYFYHFDKVVNYLKTKRKSKKNERYLTKSND